MLKKNTDAQFSHIILNIPQHCMCTTICIVLLKLLYDILSEARSYRLELNYAIELYDYIISTFMRKILIAIVHIRRK